MTATLTATEKIECRNDHKKVSRVSPCGQRLATIVKTYLTARKYNVGVQFLTDLERARNFIKNSDGTTTFPVEIL